MEHLKKELIEFKEMLVSNASVDFEFENNANEEFSELANQLQIIIDKIPSERQQACERLSHLICDDEDRYKDMEGALQLLEAQADIDGSVMADDIVMMWEPLEYRFTVDELISQVI